MRPNNWMKNNVKLILEIKTLIRVKWESLYRYDWMVSAMKAMIDNMRTGMNVTLNKIKRSMLLRSNNLRSFRALRGKCLFFR